MPTITSIRPQKNKPRVSIFLDGKFRFGIDLENLVKLNLKINQELDESEVEKIIKIAEVGKAFPKLVRFASLRPRSEKEITDWFKRQKLGDTAQEKLKGKLQKIVPINDYEFAKWWVEQRIAFKPRSRKVLTVELMQKGVDKDVIKDVLEEIDLNEYEMIKKLAEKKLRSLSRYDEETRKKKLIAFLQRKGFSWEDIRQLFD